MSDNWDFYFCKVDDKQASIFVDLDLMERAPITELRHMANVSLRMRAPRDDGLSSQEEFESLIQIEDEIVKKLVIGNSTVMVGRNTSNGCRDFYFYTNNHKSWNAAVDATMAAFPDYEYARDVREEPEWDTYLQFLYPSDRDRDRERIQNRRVCESLEKRGDPLTANREIDHWAYFPSEELRSRFLRTATEQGFSVRGLLEPDEKRSEFGLQLYRVDTPSFENIDSIVLPLFELARKHSGNYDGWETIVLNESDQVPQ